LRAGSLGWLGEQDLDEKRRVRKALYTSLGVHGLLLAALVVSPPTAFAPMPQTISVELLAAPPSAAPPAPSRSKGRPKPPPPAAKPKPPEPAPDPPPEPAPPIAKAPVKVLPENAPKPDQAVKQAPKEKPKEVAKADPKPRPAEKPAESDEELSYEDAMKSLDDELGPDETADLLEPAPERPSRSSADSSGQARSQSGVRIDPALAAWYQATLRRIQSRWVTPAAFRDRGLATVMSLRLSAAGEVMGEPEVTRSSGDPYFDDNAVRAVLSASPLPAPPRAGETQFIFRSEEN
jgi:TonB family protein